jgi:UDP-3-O-acyl-N-acetylglucosamine deacetylase
MKYLLDDIKKCNKYINNVEEIYAHYIYKDSYIKLLSKIILELDNENIIIEPISEYYGISYLVLFDKYHTRRLLDYKIKNLKQIEDKEEIKKEFSKIRTFNLVDVKKYHMYEFTLSDTSIFKFGLVNSSNGNYDGWIELYVDKN